MNHSVDLLDTGLVGLPDALAGVEELTRPSGERVLAVRTAGGWCLDVLPDRGLDLGAAWWAGTPVAWRSPNPVDPGPGADWESRFLGGLLATCGPDNIGEPREGHGQHGTHHLSHAYDVRWWRERTAQSLVVHVTGKIAHSSLGGPRIVVDRHVTLATDDACVQVDDLVTNVGDQPAGVPLLYHVNLGAPLLVPGARLQVAAGSTRTREPLPAGRSPLVMPQPGAALAPVVAEHRDLETIQGQARAVLTGTGVGLAVVVQWNAQVLPRLCTWAWPAAGAWVLGVEPTNAPLFGAERELPWAGAPVLQPGQQWRTGVLIAVRPQTEV
ncbi:MAG: DUF4432 family protein [Cellulomonas sp.]|nr:DUF4432 family protein [Cellulomonas sp.]